MVQSIALVTTRSLIGTGSRRRLENLPSTDDYTCEMSRDTSTKSLFVHFAVQDAHGGCKDRSVTPHGVYMGARVPRQDVVGEVAGLGS